jgi:hypothetical protein
MRVRLKWTDQNLGPHTTKIYRSDTQPVGQMPTGSPLVTLSNGETEWDDTTVTRGNTYWYTFVSSNGTQEIPSIPVQVIALPRNGPGPQTLMSGDLDLGLYSNSVTAEKLISNARLKGMLNAPGTANTTENVWAKFSRKGKTLFVPRRAVAYSVSWTQLYLAGLMYGVDGNGPQAGGVTPTNQKRIVSIGQDDFIVRCMTYVNDDDNPTRVLPAGVAVNAIGPYRKRSEFNDLVVGQHRLFPPNRSIGLPGTVLNTQSTYGMGSGAFGFQPITQELNASNQHMTTSAGFTNNTDIVPCSNGLLVAAASPSANYGWWPVLELIEQIEVVV